MISIINPNKIKGNDINFFTRIKRCNFNLTVGLKLKKYAK